MNLKNQNSKRKVESEPIIFKKLEELEGKKMKKLKLRFNR